MALGRPARILLLGASGLIGRFVTDDLRARGFHVVGVARKFSASQRNNAFDLDLPVLSMDAVALSRLIRDHAIEIIVNCLGVLQDGPGSDTSAVHRDFVARLLQAIGDSGRAVRLVHISIPGDAKDDRTAFSATKREAEALIAASGIAYAILRPGFVVAPSAYGGSALLRALAALPVDLPTEQSATPLQPVAVENIAETIAFIADHEEVKAVSWDLMQPQKISLGGVIDQFRFAFGTAKMPRVTLPSVMLDLGARCGDLVNRLGWMPPMRTTAIAELRRGVTGDPKPWMDATGIAPKTIAEMVGRRATTIQDKWFARLFPDQAADDREPCAVLDPVRLHRAGDLVSGDQGDPHLARLSLCHRRAIRRDYQPDGHEHRRADRIPQHLRGGSRGGNRAVAGLHGGNGDPDAGSLVRAARRAGQDGAGNRADAGDVDDSG